MGKQRLTPNLHPTGTRFVGTWEKVLFEATVVEWSPSGKLVCLAYEDSTLAWKDEMPVVVEVLERPVIRLPIPVIMPLGGPYEITVQPFVQPFQPLLFYPWTWVGDAPPVTITASTHN